MLNKGDYFGEVSLVHDCPTSASVKSLNYCTFAKLPKSIFNTLCKNFLLKVKNKTYVY